MKKDKGLAEKPEMGDQKGVTCPTSMELERKTSTSEYSRPQGQHEQHTYLDGVYGLSGRLMA